MYYIEFNPKIKQKLRDEIKGVIFGINNDSTLFETLSITEEQWIEKLSYDKLQDG